MMWSCRSADYAALLVDVWVFMVLPTVFALTKSILPISQGENTCLPLIMVI